MTPFTTVRNPINNPRRTGFPQTKNTFQNYENTTIIPVGVAVATVLVL